MMDRMAGLSRDLLRESNAYRIVRLDAGWSGRVESRRAPAKKETRDPLWRFPSWWALIKTSPTEGEEGGGPERCRSR